jgi:hypothetical protein
MHDHLKDAATAAVMTNDELFDAARDIGRLPELTGLQQAILDELSLRGLSSEGAVDGRSNRQTRAR